MGVREKAQIMDADAMNRAITRMTHEILEKHRKGENLALIGIQTRGVPLAQRMARKMQEIEGVQIPVGILDITLYRDDLQTIAYQPVVHKTEIGFDVTGALLVLVDDVLYTGRTVRAAIDELIDFGRPRAIRLAVLIDRGHRELPIRADFVGKNVPTSEREIIKVKVQEIDGVDEVALAENG